MKILVVDDDPMTRRAHDRILRGRGHTVTLVENGVEALKLIDNGTKFDAIISDLEMPKMPGDILCVELRRRKSNVPFLLISGSDVLERVAKVCGADRFCMKGSDLLTCIFQFLKSAEPLKQAGKPSD